MMHSQVNFNKTKISFKSHICEIKLEIDGDDVHLLMKDHCGERINTLLSHEHIELLTASLLALRTMQA